MKLLLTASNGEGKGEKGCFDKMYGQQWPVPSADAKEMYKTPTSDSRTWVSPRKCLCKQFCLQPRILGQRWPLITWGWPGKYLRLTVRTHAPLHLRWGWILLYRRDVQLLARGQDTGQVCGLQPLEPNSSLPFQQPKCQISQNWPLGVASDFAEAAAAGGGGWDDGDDDETEDGSRTEQLDQARLSPV